MESDDVPVSRNPRSDMAADLASTRGIIRLTMPATDRGIGDTMAMFGFAGLPAVTSQTLYYLKSYGVTFVVAIIGSTPIVKKLGVRIDKAVPVLQPVVTIVLLVLATASIIDGSFNPFLYFRF